MTPFCPKTQSDFLFLVIVSCIQDVQDVHLFYYHFSPALLHLPFTHPCITIPVIGVSTFNMSNLCVILVMHQ